MSEQTRALRKTLTFGDRACKNKRVYSSPAKAKKAMKKIKRAMDIYKCPICGEYHLTGRKNADI